jgi:sulfur carrier protein
MQVQVNGRALELPDGATVLDLLERSQVDRGRVAVERNEEVVPRRAYAEVALTDGDRVEIVSFVGGG